MSHQCKSIHGKVWTGSEKKSTNYVTILLSVILLSTLGKRKLTMTSP